MGAGKKGKTGSGWGQAGLGEGNPMSQGRGLAPPPTRWSWNSPCVVGQLAMLWMLTLLQRGIGPFIENASPKSCCFFLHGCSLRPRRPGARQGGFSGDAGGGPDGREGDFFQRNVLNWPSRTKDWCCSPALALLWPHASYSPSLSAGHSTIW